MFGSNAIDAALRGLILGPVALAWVVFVVRCAGARTLSKMTTFDFVVTLATGSLLATAAASSSLTGFVQALTGLTALLVTQVGLALARLRSARFKSLIENEPLLLMRDGRFIDSALARSRVSRADVYAKLREADVGDPDHAAAIILESTGDVTVLTTMPRESVMTGVRRP